MGLPLFYRKCHSIFMCFRESRVFGRKKIIAERSYCRNFGGVSSALVLYDDSDSCSSGESSGEYEPVVPIIPSKGVGSCKAPVLCSVVVRVYKTLNWEVAREISFERAAQRFGLLQSINAFKMLVHIYSYVGMRNEVYALLRGMVLYFKKVEFDLIKIFPLLLNSPNDAKISALVADLLIKVFAANEMFENGIHAYFQAKKLGCNLSKFSCNFLLKCLAEASRRELLQILFEEMKQFGPSPTVYTYTIILNYYCCKNRMRNQSDIEMATNIMVEMDTKGIKGISPSVVTYSVYIHGLCRAGDVFGALDYILYLRNKNQLLNSYCYNAVIRGFCIKGKVDEGMKLFEEMKSCGVSPDVYSYSILIDGFCKCGNVEKARYLMDEMQKSNLEPSLVSYTSLLHGLCRFGQMEYAIDKFYQLKGSRYEHDPIDYHILTSALCTAVINRLCKEGNLKKAQEAIPLMLKMNILPSLVNYSSLINGFAKVSHFRKAFLLCRMMEKDGVTPDKILYTIIINLLCTIGKVVEAVKIFEKMKICGVKPDVYSYSILIDGFCRCWNVKEARCLIDEILKGNIKLSLVSYSYLLHGLCLQGDSVSAHKFLKEMICNNMTTNAFSYMCTMDKVSKACEHFKKMAREGLDPDTICRVGGMEMALELYNEMLGREIKPSVVTYTCLVNGFLKFNRMDMAKEMRDEMRRNNVSPDHVYFDTWLQKNRKS